MAKWPNGLTASRDGKDALCRLTGRAVRHRLDRTRSGHKVRYSNGERYAQAQEQRRRRRLLAERQDPLLEQRRERRGLRRRRGSKERTETIPLNGALDGRTFSDSYAMDVL